MGLFKKNKISVYTAQGAYQKTLANIGKEHSDVIKQIAGKIEAAIFCNKMSVCIKPWPAEYWPIVSFLKGLGYKFEFIRDSNLDTRVIISWDFSEK